MQNLGAVVFGRIYKIVSSGHFWLVFLVVSGLWIAGSFWFPTWDSPRAGFPLMVFAYTLLTMWVDGLITVVQNQQSAAQAKQEAESHSILQRLEAQSEALHEMALLQVEMMERLLTRSP